VARVIDERHASPLVEHVAETERKGEWFLKIDADSEGQHGRVTPYLWFLPERAVTGGEVADMGARR
jgi:hypothetical protein